MSSYAVIGQFEGQEASILCTDGDKLTGVPLLALQEIELERRRLLATHETVPATPTGPFYPARSPQALLLTIMSVIEAPEVVGHPPPVPIQPDEILGRPASGTKSVKATVQVRPYIREGHPVSGYTRHTSQLIKSAAEGASEIADAVTASQLAAIREHEQEIMDLKPGESVRFNTWDIERGSYNTVFKVHTYVVHGFGVRVYNAKPEEVIPLMENAVLEKRNEAYTNWKRKLHGKLVNKRSDPKTYAEISGAISDNESNPAWESFLNHTRIPDIILAWNEQGTTRADSPGFMDILTCANRNVDDHRTNLNGYAVQLKVDLDERRPAMGLSTERRFHPGMAGIANDTRSVLRHEYAHSVWEALTDEQRKEFIDLLPHKDGEVDEHAISEGLSQYASLASYQDDPMLKEYYEKHVAPKYTNIPDGYRTETFAEAVSAVTDRSFKRDEWPDWMGKVADFVQELKLP